MAVWCTKQSLPPFSGVMKPNPFASLNHFTVPVIRAICALLLACTVPAASRLALTPPLNGGTFIEAFLLHVLKQARFGDLTVELLQHHFQPVGLLQRDFHSPRITRAQTQVNGRAVERMHIRMQLSRPCAPSCFWPRCSARPAGRIIPQTRPQCARPAIRRA